MSVIRTKALILRHTTDREHDRMLTILTPTMGQQRVRARGTKKSLSKLGGSLEPLMEVDLNIADGRTVGLVTGSVIRHRFEPLRKDLVSLVLAQWLMELVELVTKPDQPETGLYDLVLRELTAMIKEISWSAGRRWMANLRRAVLIMMHEGFVPSLIECANCHKPLSDADCVYHPHHGFVHRAEAPVDAVSISSAVYNYLLGYQEEIDTKQNFSELHYLVEQLIYHTLDRPLKSENIVRLTLRRNQLPK